MRPVTFGGNFGFLHDAPGDCAVIMCSAMGHEQLCASRGWRDLADNIASAGYPVLRFDWPGCGDSLGQDSDTDRMGAWSAALLVAVDYARSSFGVERIVLLGLRLGASLAILNAAQVRAEGAILLAPVISGRMYLRELSAMRSVGLAADATIADGYEVAGYLITSETEKQINAIDLRKLEKAPARHVLAVMPDAQFHADDLMTRLEGLGCNATREPFEGYEAYLADITLSEIPRASFDRVIGWLVEQIPVQPRSSTESNGGPALHVTPDFVERPLLFGKSQSLFGIHCDRPGEAASKIALIILNTGLNPHVGWARFGVQMARHLAGKGVATFRIDGAGIGDSPPLPGREPLPVYDPALNGDVRDAIDVMKAAGHDRILLFGTCSGAYLAFYSALEDPRVDGLILVNLEKFVWRKEYALSITQGFKGSSFYFGRVRDLKTWKRLFRGELNLTGIAPELLRRAARVLKTRFQEAARFIHEPDDDTTLVRKSFRLLAERHAPILLAYTDEDAARDELYLHFGNGGRRLGSMSNVEIGRLGQADHAISSQAARGRLLEIVTGFLDRRVRA